jgi:hypothetical protein
VTGPSGEQSNSGKQSNSGEQQNNRTSLVSTSRTAAATLTAKLKSQSRQTKIGIFAGAAIVIVGIGVALVALLGRPTVSVSSGQALVEVHTGGVGTEVTEMHVTSAGKPVALAHDSAGLVPVTAMPQGETVHVSVTAQPPSYLRWLLGSGVSTSATLRAPKASPAAQVALAAHPEQVTLSFDRPVSVIEYRGGDGRTKVIRLSQPSATAQVPVPAHLSGGSLQVAAAAWPWEHLAAASTVDWIQAPHNGLPVAAADPAPGSAQAGLESPITLTFDEPVAKALGSSRPQISPATAGTWTEPGPDTLVFTPKGLGFGPGTPVTVTFNHPVTVVGGTSAGSVLVSASASYHFAVTHASVLRLQQILAQLHYLPLNFTPAPGVRMPTTLAAEAATLGSPLKGDFSWRFQSIPPSLRELWQPGSPTVMVKGALMAFMSASESSSYDGLTADNESVAQLADHSWKALLTAAAANQADPWPYSYVHVSEHLPETLTLWESGRTVLTTLVNTGIPGQPTTLGTNPVYLRYTVNQMSGTNPDGSTYDDTVYWINYFSGGDAVHAFPRGSYGFPQSLGCVELPYSNAETAFHHLAIGDLVTVVP